MKNETSLKKDSVEEIESISNWTIWQPSCAISLFKDTEDNTRSYLNRRTDALYNNRNSNLV